MIVVAVGVCRRHVGAMYGIGDPGCGLPKPVEVECRGRGSRHQGRGGCLPPQGLGRQAVTCSRRVRVEWVVDWYLARSLANEAKADAPGFGGWGVVTPGLVGTVFGRGGRQAVVYELCGRRTMCRD